MTDAPVTVLVVGGYGVFGRTICRLLAHDRNIHVVVAGRSAEKAAGLARDIRSEWSPASVEGVRIDKRYGVDDALRATGARLLIDAAGPFQGGDYAVAQSCIGNGVHYVDLADAREFVAGFDALDAAARSAGVLAVSGASSVPGLSGAAADHLTRDLVRTDEITVAIAPGNHAPRGPAVVAAILAYVGRPMPRWRDGRFGQVYGWQDVRRICLRLPDGTEIGRRWVAACDVPDNVLFPRRYNIAETMAFRAGLELGVLHFGLWILSWPVRWRLIGSLAPLAPIAYRVAGALKSFGSDRGGMVVEAAGEASDGRPARRRWTLLAGSGHGPQVPGIPAVIVARKLANGAISRSGAMPCLDLFDLRDFEAAVADLDIRCAVEDIDG